MDTTFSINSQSVLVGSLMAMIAIGLLLIGFLIVLALLAKSEHTRAVLKGLVVVPVLLAVGFVVFAIWEPTSRRHRQPTAVELPRPLAVQAIPDQAARHPWASLSDQGAPKAVLASVDASLMGRAEADRRFPRFIEAAEPDGPAALPTPPKATAHDPAKPANSRMTVILKPADAKATGNNEASIAVDISTEEGKQAQMAGLLLALANALRKAVADNPQAETAARFVANVVTTPSRPLWVATSPRRVGDVFQVPWAIGPFETRMECDRKLPDELRKALDGFVGQFLGPEAVGQVSLPDDYLRTHVLREEWEEKRNVTMTSTQQVPMVLLHVLLGFDNDVKDRLLNAWHRLVIVERLRNVGLVVAVVLIVLSTVWAYLRIDLSTAGAYRNRLRLAAVLVVALLAVLAARWA